MNTDPAEAAMYLIDSVSYELCGANIVVLHEFPGSSLPASSSVLALPLASPKQRLAQPLISNK